MDVYIGPLVFSNYDDLQFALKLGLAYTGYTLYRGLGARGAFLASDHNRVAIMLNLKALDLPDLHLTTGHRSLEAGNHVDDL